MNSNELKKQMPQQEAAKNTFNDTPANFSPITASKEDAPPKRSFAELLSISNNLTPHTINVVTEEPTDNNNSKEVLKPKRKKQRRTAQVAKASLYGPVMENDRALEQITRGDLLGEYLAIQGLHFGKEDAEVDALFLSLMEFTTAGISNDHNPPVVEMPEQQVADMIIKDNVLLEHLLLLARDVSKTKVKLYTKTIHKAVACYGQYVEEDDHYSPTNSQYNTNSTGKISKQVRSMISPDSVMAVVGTENIMVTRNDGDNDDDDDLNFSGGEGGLSLKHKLPTTKIMIPALDDDDQGIPPLSSSSESMKMDMKTNNPSLLPSKNRHHQQDEMVSFRQSMSPFSSHVTGRNYDNPYSIWGQQEATAVVADVGANGACSESIQDFPAVHISTNKTVNMVIQNGGKDDHVTLADTNKALFQ